MTTTATKPTARTEPSPQATPSNPARKPAPVKAVAPKEQAEAKPVPTTLVEALTTRLAMLLKVRGNGTKHSLPYLAVGTKQRAEAEAVAKMKADGQTVEAIAEALKGFNATARRFLTNLALANAVNSGDHDAAWTPGTKDVVVHTVVRKAAAAA